MEIKILGNGGCINKGLHYNSFIINEKHLCELPPDIMFTLYSNKININEIETIFISHLHGDHIFGLPFFILELFYNSIEEKIKNRKIDIFGPCRIKDHSKKLLNLAYNEDHPSIKWMDENINFIEINEKSNSSFIRGYDIEFIKLNHSIDTYGFVLYDNENISHFCYIPDTLWNENIKKALENKPKAVLIDLNGQKNDKHKVHLSIDDLLEYAVPITRDKTIYYGTHLKEEFKEVNKKIKCCKSGELITI